MPDSLTKPLPEAIRVRDYMTPNPETLDATQSLLAAVLLLRKAGFRHIPILERGKLEGVFTERDLWRFSPSLLLPTSQQDYNRVFEETPLEKVMSRNPQTIGPDAPLTQALDLLMHNRHGCLPVMEADQLVGIITIRDMLRALYDLIAPIPMPTPPSE
jgi:CBS domain-containing protein